MFDLFKKVIPIEEIWDFVKSYTVAYLKFSNGGYEESEESEKDDELQQVQKNTEENKKKSWKERKDEFIKKNEFIKEIKYKKKEEILNYINHNDLSNEAFICILEELERRKRAIGDYYVEVDNAIRKILAKNSENPEILSAIIKDKYDPEDDVGYEIDEEIIDIALKNKNTPSEDIEYVEEVKKELLLLEESNKNCSKIDEYLKKDSLINRDLRNYKKSLENAISEFKVLVRDLVRAKIKGTKENYEKIEESKVKTLEVLEQKNKKVKNLIDRFDEENKKAKDLSNRFNKGNKDNFQEAKLKNRYSYFNIESVNNSDNKKNEEKQKFPQPIKATTTTPTTIPSPDDVSFPNAGRRCDGDNKKTIEETN